LIWVGDLNYRINLTEAEVKAALRKRDLASLIEYDQLTIEREGGRTFHVFDEGQIDFLPTYKYDVGTNRYDTSEKRRAPAWTDRVLWRKARAHLEPHAKEGHHSDIQLTSYASCMDMMMSDHKPVNAIMRLKARKIDVERQAKVKSDIVKGVVENREDRGPDARISNSFVEFGDVRFMTEKEVSITLENTGHMVDSWCFIPKLNEAVICKPWLEISKLSGVLGPGKKSHHHFKLLQLLLTRSSFMDSF
jgi:phosphatidylinositol-bisphosphatase